MADETNNNEATELVGDHVETVDVSKHPDPSIPVTDLSLADIERRQSHPVPWAVFIVAVLAAIIAPYWLGRSLAVGHTQWLITHLNLFTPRGVAFVSWTVTLTTFTGLGLAVVESRNWLCRIVFVVGLAAEQFIAGLSLLKLNFWYSTYVVYGDSAQLPNAANLGIIAAGVGVAVYAGRVGRPADPHQEGLSAERADAQLGFVHPVLRHRDRGAAHCAVRRIADGGVRPCRERPEVVRPLAYTIPLACFARG